MAKMVSDSIRNANSRAIDARDRWRKRYSLLVKVIRDNKRAMKVNPFDREAKVKAMAYRAMADDMMHERWMITLDLRDTAYAYADFRENLEVI